MDVNVNVLRGEMAGRRAEVRLETERVHIHVLAVVSQQPVADVSVSISELLEFRLVSKPQWSLGVGFLAIGAFLMFGAGSASPETRTAVAVLFGVLGVVGIALGYLFPFVFLVVRDPRHTASVQLSRFSRSRAKQLVAAVHARYPSLSLAAA